MTDEQERLMDLFNEARGRGSGAEREAYLASACGGDAALRRRVEALLEADTQLGGFLEPPSADPVQGEGPESVIGHYKLLEQIGEGGFGVVFMAEQLEPVRRRVALKIVKPGMDTRQVIARFEAERQALAMMDHPNIARVFDAGITERGYPYFVMELVHGVPITRFCDANQLSTTERLRLFMAVCSAVQHAHQKGIIHRDLKPSNILVTLHDGTPVPKVIDFGTAKALDQPLTEKTMFTAYGRFIGTPQYMSPEQAELSGLDVDTRADVYSLGVLLYELLTGTTPFEPEQLRAAAFDEMMRMIRETPPPRPSTRVSTLGRRATSIAGLRQVDANVLKRSLRGDLDWIVMKALEKDRERRYGTVGALGEDLQRHLAHLPVVAGPPGRVYRARKFVKRHRMGVTMAALLSATLAVGLVVSLIGFSAARQQRNHAEVLAAEAALDKGQSKLEAGDSWGLFDLVQAYELAQHNPALLRAVGRRWSTWHAYWDRRTIAVLPMYGTPSPDHLQFASVDTWVENNTSSVANLYDVLTGARVAGPMVHNAPAVGCAFGPDGSLLATITDEGVIHLWDRENGQPLRPPCETGIPELNTLLFSPCGRYLAASSREYMGAKSPKVALVSLQAPHEAAQILDHRYSVEKACFSPDGELLATHCEPDLMVWRTSDGKPVGPPVPITWSDLLEFGPDGNRLAYNPEGQGGVGLMDPRTLQRVQHLPGGAAGPPLCTFSHGGHLLAAFDWDCRLQLWKLDASDEPYATLQTRERSGGLTFSPDDSLLAVGEVSGKVHVLRTNDGHVVHTMHTGQSPRPAFLANHVLVSQAWGWGHFWDLAASPLPGTALPHDALAFSLACDPSGSLLAVGAEDEVRFWKLQPTPELTGVVPMPGRVMALTFLAEEEAVAAFCDDGTLTRVEPRTGRTTLSRNLGCGYGASGWLSPDARKVVLVSPRLSSPLIVDTQTGTRDRLARAGGARSVAFQRDARRMAIGTAGWKVCLYDIGASDAAPEGCLEGFGGWVESVAFHPNGRLIAACVEEHTIRLYDTVNDRQVFSAFAPSLATVTLLRFSPDGSLLAASGLRPGGGHGVELWHMDPERGLFLGCPPLPCDHPVWSMIFSPDNRTLIAGGLGSTRLWHLPPAPADLEDIRSRTWEALGFRLDGEQHPVYLDPPTNDVDGIRTRLTQEPVSSDTALDAALRRPPADALTRLRFLADRHPGVKTYQRLLGRLHAALMVTHAEQGSWATARIHAEEALRLGHDDPYTRYRQALLCLADSDIAGYRGMCRAMAEHYASCNDPEVMKWVGWTAALAPGGLNDYQDLVQQVQRAFAGAAGPDAADYRFYLAAVLARAGRHAEAVTELESAGRRLRTAAYDVSFFPVYYQYVLAICHAHLGDERTAQHGFEQASMDVENLFRADAGAEHAASVPWNRRLTLELLRKEAEAALSTLAPQPTPSG